MTTTNKNTLSAPVSVSALSALFEGEDASLLQRIADDGFSVSSATFDNAAFYHSGFGGVISLSALRYNYEMCAEDYAADEGINTFREYVDAVTDMGGDCRPIYGHFYSFKINGSNEMDIDCEGDEYADTDLEHVIDLAEWKAEGTNDKIEIVRYELSAKWFEYLPKD